VVSDGNALQTAMNNAMPGDVIAVSPGTYTAMPVPVTVHGGPTGTLVTPVVFEGPNGGTASQPITLTALDPSNPPVLQGSATAINSGYVVHVSGGYWNIQNIIATNDSKGIVLDACNDSLICGVEVHGTGDEGLHLRDGTSNTTVEGADIHDTGQVQPQYGEGFYVGSWQASDPGYNRACDNNVIKDSHVGPNIGSKYVNLQPGATSNTVSNVYFQGPGTSCANAGTAFVSNKDPKATITGCQFHFNGKSCLTQDISNASGGACGCSNNQDFP
jgi:endoglucanase